MSFNTKYSSSLVTQGGMIAVLDNDLFERGDFVGAYRQENDWRQGWSKLN
jgi:hypothetical protein